MQFKVTDKNGRRATIEADRFEQDGSGTRFFDAEGNQIVSYYDGVIRSVEPVNIEWE